MRAYRLAIAVWALAVILFIFVLIPTPIYISIYKQPTEYKQQHYDSYNDFAQAVLGKIGDAIFSAGFWTAAATLAIACFTYRLKQATDRLKRSTDNLWKAGEKQRRLYEKTAERQLRAYVWVAEASINNVVGPDIVHATLEIKNSGQTPATEVTTWANLGFGQYPAPNIDHLPGRPDSVEASKSYLGPGGSLFLEPKAGRLYSCQEKAAINAKTRAVYVWGEINYRDAFMEDRYTKFVLFKGGDVDTEGQNLGSYRDGNKAT